MTVLLADIKSWLAAPYGPQMSALQVFLLTGLVIIAVVAWGRILSFIDAE